MIRFHHRRLLLAPALVAALVLTACSNDEQAGDPAETDPTTTTAVEGVTAPDEADEQPATTTVAAELALAEVQGAATATREVESGRFEFRVAVDAGGDEPMVSRTRVEFAGDDSRARSSSEGPGTEADPQLGDLSEYEILVHEGSTYLRGQIVDTVLGGGAGRWVRLPADRDAALDQAFLISNPLGADGFLSLVEQADGEVRSLGTEEVRGTRCEHLRVLVPPEGFSGLDTPELQSIAPGLFDEEVPVDVWACQDGLIHKVEMTLGSGGQTATITGELYDLGEPIEIAPPDDAVDIDPESLFGGLFGPGGG